MKTVIPTFTLLLLVIATQCAFGQSDFFMLSGKVTDAQTSKPIPFVNIHLKSRSIGTATNVEGEFIFKIPKSYSTDTLLISCIGYTTIAKSLESIGSSISVALEPVATEMATLTIHAQSGLDILKKMISKIPENYDTSNVQMTAFYRENIWLDDFELSYNEAVLDIHKIFKTDLKNPNDQIRIIKGRKKQIDLSKEGQLYYWMSGISNGARGSLNDDLIKYGQRDFSPFNPRNYKYYKYEYNGLIKEGDRTLIILDIVPKENARRGILLMKLFIEEDSYALAKYDYALSEAGVRRVSRKDKGLAYSIMTKIVNATMDYHKFEGTFVYQRYNNKWYLKTITRDWEILVNSRKRNMVDVPWRADMDFMITDINTEDTRPINTQDIGRNETSLNHIIFNDNDTSFWQHYNILKPVIPDSLKRQPFDVLKPDKKVSYNLSATPNRPYVFTRGDSLRGKLTPLRTCYDVTFYHLDVDVDLNNRSIKGNNLIRFAVKQPFKKMQVDLYANMKIDSILYRKQRLPYTREYDAVFIDFPEELQRDTQSEIKIYYNGIPKVPDWSIPMNGGVLWDTDSLGNPWVQMVCQGSGASLWWPNKDHQSDEPDSMKIWIAVPEDFEEVSNGRLIRRTPVPGDKMRYEWYVSYPINNYNVTFNIGKYAHFRDHYISDDTLTIDYYVMDYNLDRSKKMFGQVHPMLRSFEKNYGKYPFKRDGFALVESIYPMEHQSGVCIGKITHQTSGDINPLLWHEAAHEWWGNAITTKDIADMWIHEAFATYAEYQVIEERFGKEAAYLAILEQVEAVKSEQPLIGKHDVNHIFYDIGDMYSKGSLMLHTFRNVLNDDTLWVNLLRDIQQQFKYQTLSSDELIQFINNMTKSDYSYFFDQYLKHTNIPLLEVTLQQKEKNLAVAYRWAADVQNFRMPASVTTQRKRYAFIYPTTKWQTMVIENMQEHEFDVDDERFFIKVNID